MALGDYRWDPEGEDITSFAFRVPSDWYFFITFIYQNSAGLFVLLNYSYAEKTTSIQPDFLVSPGLISVSPLSRVSTYMRDSDSVTHTRVELTNDVIANAWITPTRPAWFEKTPGPRLSDLLMEVIGAGTQVKVDMSMGLQTGGGAGTALLPIVSGRIHQIVEANDNSVILEVVTDYRWDDTIPRHKVLDITSTESAESGMPQPLHYGRWGSAGLGPGTSSEVPFYPYGLNWNEEKAGGFRSPVPLTPLGGTIASSGTNYRPHLITRSFGTIGGQSSGAYQCGSEHGDCGIMHVAHSYYLFNGSQWSRLNSGHVNIIDESHESVIAPESRTKIELDVNQSADASIFPERIWFTTFNSTDSVKNMTSPIVETWVTETVAAGSFEIVGFIYGTVPPLGILDEPFMVTEFWVEAVDPGTNFSIKVTQALNYGPGGGDIVTDNFTFVPSTVQEGMYAYHRVSCAAAKDSTKNHMHNWDFTLFTGGTPEDRSDMVHTITFTEMTGLTDIRVHIRRAYLLVNHRPFLRLIEEEVILPGDSTVISRGRDPASNPYQVNIHQKFEPVRNVVPRVFADSHGHRDIASGKYTGQSFQVMDNPCSIIAHMLEQFPLDATTPPSVEWGTNSYLDLRKLRDVLNYEIEGGTQGDDDTYRVRWLVDKETSILESARMLARENMFHLEELRNVWGAWHHRSGFFSETDPEAFWREMDRFLEPEDCLAFSISQTPMSGVVNDLTILYAYDYATNRFMRNMRTTPFIETTTLPGPVDPPESWQFAHQNAVDSYAKYGEIFPRIVKLKSVYRAHEAALIRDTHMTYGWAQHAIITADVHPPVWDLAMNGKVFRVHDEMGRVFQMPVPFGLLHGNENMNWHEFTWGSSHANYFPLYWRVIAAEFHPDVDRPFARIKAMPVIPPLNTAT